MKWLSVEEIDAVLPQTQCGLCGYGGCMPYAKALLDKAAPINLCPPGGVETLTALGELLNQDINPYLAEMGKNNKPTLLAAIREAECIGCTKCIQACPVDAIIGTAKAMHTVIAAECTGCELCIPPCPVDCIDIIVTNTENKISPTTIDLRRKRFNAKEERLEISKKIAMNRQQESNLEKKKNYIKEAIARVNIKKAAQ